MRKAMWIAVLGGLCLVGVGCKDLNEQQLGAYVGDKESKVVYKNVGGKSKEIPNERQEFFRSVDDAMAKGYTMSNVAGDETSSSEE